MITLIRKIDRAINPLRDLAQYVGSPLWDLAARLYVANVFFKSGMLRFADWSNGNFASQIDLFTSEHPVPGIPPVIAAYMSTGGELVLPVLLALGLFGRFAAAGLLVMTLVIELTYIHATDHILWIFLAAALFIKGPGAISVDWLLLRVLRKGA